MKSVQLASIATLVLALATSGCWCRDVPDDVYQQTLDNTFMDADLDELRMGTMSDEERCEAACMQMAMSSGTDDLGGSGEYDSMLSCEAFGGDDTLPTWDAGQTEVTVSCQVEYREPGFCTGRRPLAHREQTVVGHTRAAWFAELAYLERASILAFEQLAGWLARRGAPAELIERCRAAADDEVVHGDRMAALAEREGASVPELAPCSPDADAELLAVALHNAVEGCVREAFGALLGAYQAHSCDEPELRELFATIADDELRHGQLAWDLHAWLLAQLDDDAREQVGATQRRALAELAHETRQSADRTPRGLGWPSPELAAGMATHFATLLAA
jgi:hypothetical protein